MFCVVFLTPHSVLVRISGDEPRKTLSKEENKLRLPVLDGSVDAAEFFDRVASQLHWTTDNLAKFARNLPKNNGSALLPREPSSRLCPELLQILVRLYPSVFSIESNAAKADSFFVVDLRNLNEKWSSSKTSLRHWLAEAEGVSICEIFHFRGIPTNGRPGRIVIVLAGLNGHEETAANVADEINKQTNLATCAFRYPNDASIVESAGLLMQQLGQLQTRFPDSKLSIVAHSMGGIVAREAIENSTLSELSNLRIDQLIQVCPPNHGSRLAEFAPLLEALEHMQRWSSTKPNRSRSSVFAMLIDGLNEAPAELVPNSDFLKVLNARTVSPNVRYSILAGSDGPIDRGVSSLLSLAWSQFSSQQKMNAGLERRIQSIVDAPELCSGSGDGVVCLDSAKRDGVRDFKVLKIHHLVWNDLESSNGKLLMDEIVDRLGVAL